MTNEGPLSGSEGPSPRRRQAVIIGSIVGGVIVLGVVAALAVSAAGGDPASSDPRTSPGASVSSTASPTPSPSVPASPPASDVPATPDDRFGLPVGAEVPSSEPATVGGATVSIESITVEQASGARAGETAGPAARVAVRIANPADAADLDLSFTAVRAYTGGDLIPASPIDEQTGFAGTVAPGESATGTYLFSIPEGAQGSLTVTFGLRPDAGLVVFTP